MTLVNRIAIAGFLMIVGLGGTARAEISDERVRRSIQSGSMYLKQLQRKDGSWREHPGYPGGVTSLCTLALLNAGEPVEGPVIQKALQFLRSVGEPEMVYSTALQTMVFCAAEPERDRLLIDRNVAWLEQRQIPSGRRAGSWKYSERRGTGDNSNTQFAMLALHEAVRVGVPVSNEVWRRALVHWTQTQREDGAWGYTESDPSTGSMTCAGIASVIIAMGQFQTGDARWQGGRVECCARRDADDTVERGLQWLGEKFSVKRNPSNPFAEKAWLYYYLYAVERVGRLTGRRHLGHSDWYREGAEYLIGQQDPLAGSWRGAYHVEDNPLVATSFALLFLAKGRRPVVMSQLKYGESGQWNFHRSAVQNLTRRVELRWRRELTWQTIDARAASVDDLLETPVLFISGRDALRLASEQKENLREYVKRGGFIFAEACCDGKGFDADFRALVAELFPQSQLRLLPADHAVWFAERRVDSEFLRPLYGLDACCRTSIVYSPQDLSCFWELDRLGLESEYPERLRKSIDACLAIGQNVITYATNRELKNKLDRPVGVQRGDSEPFARGVLSVPKLIHAGGSDDAPNALPNLLAFVREKAELRVAVKNQQVGATDPRLFDYPILFLHGRRDFRFSPSERDALRTFVERGGVLIADAICGSPEFAAAVRRELRVLFPDHALGRIPPDHVMFTPEFHGFDVTRVTIREPQKHVGEAGLQARRTRTSPRIEGLFFDDRVAVMLSPYDLSCALENAASLECEGYVKEDAARLAMNLILFALQQ